LEARAVASASVRKSASVRATQLTLEKIQSAHFKPEGRGRSVFESDEVGVSPHFKVVRQSDGRFHWELINPHGTPAARSMETFATEDEAVANAEYARRLISRAPVERA
jgi:hypothetical protein